MLRKTFFLIIFYFLCLFPIITVPVYAKNIIVPVDNFPPFQIFPSNNAPPHGEVISVINAIIDRVNKSHNLALKVNYTDSLPFARCLSMMKNGKADLIGGILDREDRRSYMHLFKYKQNSNKLFILRKKDIRDISSIEDLKGQTVGTTNGYVYFQEFDKNPKIFKDPVKSLFLALKKLEHKRYNVVICSATEWVTMIESDLNFTSKFKLATFKYIQKNPVYIGISKKSWLSQPDYLNVLSLTIEEMYAQNEFTSVIYNFYRQYNETNYE